MARHKAVKHPNSSDADQVNEDLRSDTPDHHSNSVGRSIDSGPRHKEPGGHSLILTKGLPMMKIVALMSLAGTAIGIGAMGLYDDQTSTGMPDSATVSRSTASSASRSSVRESIDPIEGRTVQPNSEATVDASGSMTVGKITGSWSLGQSNLDVEIPYSKSPLERVQDAMRSQTEQDMKRLEASDRNVDGFGSSKTKGGDLTLTREMMTQLRSSYKASQPAGFDEGHATGDQGNTYSFSQCTWWTYVRRHQLGLPAGSHMGDGRMWASTARSLGYWVDRNPMVGDVIVFQPGQAGADGFYGHVGVVENVFEMDGKKWIVISECSADDNGVHVSRILGDVDRFEYIHY